MGEHIANTQEDLVANLTQYGVAKVLAEDLVWRFSEFFNISAENKGRNNEYKKISLTNKLLTERSEPEIAITVQPNGTLNVHVNPYDTYDQFYFIAKDLSLDQFVGELDSIQKSLETGRMHVNSIFEKKNYITNDNDLAELVDEYTNAAPKFAEIKAEREANQGK